MPSYNQLLHHPSPNPINKTVPPLQLLFTTKTFPLNHNQQPPNNTSAIHQTPQSPLFQPFPSPIHFKLQNPCPHTHLTNSNHQTNIQKPKSLNPSSSVRNHSSSAFNSKPGSSYSPPPSTCSAAVDPLPRPHQRLRSQNLLSTQPASAFLDLHDTAIPYPAINQSNAATMKLRCRARLLKSLLLQEEEKKETRAE
ncbi:hypothetical protein M0R45_020647 [Rubus argutus]|uniref:Uncharacterized protein n=1 Tax=Rubus argutus TaxID=59490 RepID=A0AAW1XB97_RUBAR